MINWLLLSIFIPLVGAAVIWVVADLGRAACRQVALVTTLVTLAMAGYVVWQFPERTFETDLAWIGGGGEAAVDGFNVRLSVGLDGLSLWLYGLSALLSVTAVLVSWEAISDRPGLYYVLVLLLETGMLGVFAARDVILFYVFFEFTLIPLFFLIGIWGSEDRRYAALKFFLYTLAGSLLTFLGLLALVFWNAYHSESGVLSFALADLAAGLQAHPIPFNIQIWIFLALFAGFAIKVPLFPLHTWLPLAHVQAPTAGSVLLAGILLKIGTYGFVRFSLTLLPEASAAAMPWILWLAVIGIIYGALVALAQSDIKRLIAYSSVSHLGFCMLGLFAFSPVGLTGGVLQMVNHGLSTGGLFAVVGMIYERYHTRQISELGGLAWRLPCLAFFGLLFTLSSIGLPGLNGFVGEFMVLLAMFQRGWSETPSIFGHQWLLLAVLSVTGVVLGAWYMLWLVERVFFGPLREPAGDGHHAPPKDLCWREIAALAPLAIFVVWIGVAPQGFIQPTQAVVEPLAAELRQAFEARYPTGASSLVSRPEPGAVLAGEPVESRHAFPSF